MDAEWYYVENDSTIGPTLPSVVTLKHGSWPRSWIVM